MAFRIHHHAFISLLACACAALLGERAIWGQASDPLIVVLKNQTAITGVVTQTDRGLHLELANGSSLELSFNQVQFLAVDWDDAFRQLEKKVDPSDIQSRDFLFDWCLRNQLWAQAREQVNALQQAGVSAAQLDGMRDRLKSVQQQAENPAPVAAPSRVPANIPTDAEIDASLEWLPVEAQRFFNQQLQSKLIVGCAASACHDSKNEKLALWSYGAGFSQSRGFSRRNLSEVLRWVDRENPEESSLLAMASQAHGSAEHPSFPGESDSLRLLRFWVFSISDHPERLNAPLAAEANGEAMATVQDQPSSSEPKFDPQVSQTGFTDSLPAPPAHDTLIGQTQMDSPDSVVPCDPEIFNRRFHGDRRKR